MSYVIRHRSSALGAQYLTRDCAAAWSGNINTAQTFETKREAIEEMAALGMFNDSAYEIADAPRPARESDHCHGCGADLSQSQNHSAGCKE